ncbi:MAG: hypothetical protein Q8L60_02860 [Gammaproteobacteria bacterium]|nr:hypothetical protein [Gammaproteobacteria bacterium]MDP2142370.1 hypothetical protein [Gammaproteobacteria bacterium]MDP2348611.1 hypothetical protein [Gammaproteobacteria bacterium]
MTNESKTPDTSVDASCDEDREYEKSGLYPKDGKPFRLFALLGFLAGVIVFIAVSAVVLDRLLI